MSNDTVSQSLAKIAVNLASREVLSSLVNKFKPIKLDKNFIGLGQVDNTPDVNKPLTSQLNDLLASKALRDDWLHITNNHTAASDECLLVDTANGVITIILPASPAVHDYVKIMDYAGCFAINKCIVAGNGNKIMRLNENMFIDMHNISLKLTYINATVGWLLT